MARIFLPQGNLLAYADPRHVKANREFYEAQHHTTNPRNIISQRRFTEGKKYKLTLGACDGLDGTNLVYQFIKEIDNIHGLPIHSLIMRPINIPENMNLFSLTRNDCTLYGVDYEPNLQLFDSGLNWEEVKEDGDAQEIVNEEPQVNVWDLTRPFNSSDLSTYPMDYRTHDVRMFVLRLTGFRYARNRRGDATDMILTPTGTYVPREHFIKTLKVMYNRDNMPYNTSSNILKCGICTKAYTTSPSNDDLIDGQGTIFVAVETIHEDLNTGSIVGISPTFLINKGINDLFLVSWDECRHETLYNFNRLNAAVPNMERNIDYIMSNLERNIDYTMSNMERNWVINC